MGHFVDPFQLKGYEISQDFSFTKGAFNQFPDQAGTGIALGPGQKIRINELTSLFFEEMQRVLKRDLLV